MENLTNNDQISKGVHDIDAGTVTELERTQQTSEKVEAPMNDISDAAPEHEFSGDHSKDVIFQDPVDMTIANPEPNNMPVESKDTDSCPGDHKSFPVDSQNNSHPAGGETLRTEHKEQLESGLGRDKEVTTKEADSPFVQKEKKKSKLYPYQPADMTFWDSMQRHREGKDEPIKQPPIKTAKVIKKSKVQIAADLLSRLRSAPAPGKRQVKDTKVAQSMKTEGNSRLVVVVEAFSPSMVDEEGGRCMPCEGDAERKVRDLITNEPAKKAETSEEAIVNSRETMSQNKKNASLPGVHDTTNVPPDGVPTALPLKQKAVAISATTPPASAAARKPKTTNLPTALVKQGAVRKRAKASQKDSKDQAPQETHITVVKVDPLIQELRAQRNRPLGGDSSMILASGSTEDNPENDHSLAEGEDGPRKIKKRYAHDLHEEISKILLDYCSSKVTPSKDDSVSDSLTTSVEKSYLEERQGESKFAKKGEKEATTATRAATRQGFNVDYISPEMMLEQRVFQLCQRDDVTPAILDMLSELIRHTRVIRDPPSSTSGGPSDQSQDQSAAPNPCESSTNARDSVEKRKRQWDQQMILVLINHIRQKKLNEEYRRRLLHDQKQIAADVGGKKTELASPCASSAVNPFLDGTYSNQPQKTLFVPQGSRGVSSLNPAAPAFVAPYPVLPTRARQFFSPDTATQCPPTSQVVTPMNPYATPFVARDSGEAPSIKKEVTVSSLPTSLPPCSFPLDANLIYLLESFKERLQDLTTSVSALTVNVSARERQALMAMQENFRNSVKMSTLPSMKVGPGRFTPGVVTNGDPEGLLHTSPFTTFKPSNMASASASHTQLCQASGPSEGVCPDAQAIRDIGGRPGPGHALTGHRTVFTYKTVQLPSGDENSASVGSCIGSNGAMHPFTGGGPFVLPPHPASLQRRLNHDAKPFTLGEAHIRATGGAMSGMNVNAPAFTPASLQGTRPAGAA